MSNYITFILLFFESTFSFAQRKNLPMKITDRYFNSIGLINIQDKNNTIIVDLMYAKPDNFTGEVLYNNLTKVYLHPDAAKAIRKAKKLLQERRPGHCLIIYDAARQKCQLIK